MAQYHFAATLVCRSKGQSAVAAAAYRAGVRLEDERLGKTFDYTRRRGVLHTEICTAANDQRDRGQLWNAVEKSEKRKDSQLARSIDIALPHELTLGLNLELVRGFVREKFVTQGMIADFAIHAPGRKGDIRNVHVHILLTTREIAGQGFGPKVRAWNGKTELLEWRKAWADHANRILEREGFEERIDHRSLSDQGIDREPTTHVGPVGKEMEERGDVSDRAQKNRDIKSTNDNIELLEKELAESEQRLAELKQQQAAERMGQIQKTIRAADAVWKKAEERWPSPDRPPEPQPPAPVPPLQPQGPSPYPETSAPPVSAGGKAVSMPDDLSKAQKQEADRQKQAQDDLLAREQKALDDEKNRLQQLRDADNKRVEDLAKQNADRLAALAEEMRQLHLRLDAQKELLARLDAHRAEQERVAADARGKEEIERQARLEALARASSIREAGLRYGEALRQNYDIRDPYASLAKTAIAEHAAFRRDREAYDQQIAKTADPQERQALDLRKRIEGAEYLAMTGDRIAQQSVIITGRRDSDEAVKFRKRATDYRIEAQDLRQQLRELQLENAPGKDLERERSELQPQNVRRPGGPPSNQYDPLIKKVDDEAKARELAAGKDPERKQQQEKELERQRERGRER